jgi:hypothetical protein
MTNHHVPGGLQGVAERVFHASEDVQGVLFAARTALMVQGATPELSEHPAATRLIVAGKETALDVAAVAIGVVKGTSKLAYNGLEHRRHTLQWKSLGLTPAEIRANHSRARLAKKSNVNFM